MNSVVHAYAIRNTTDLNNILFGHSQQIGTREMCKSGHVLTETMLVYPLDELRRCHILIDDESL